MEKSKKMMMEKKSEGDATDGTLTAEHREDKLVFCWLLIGETLPEPELSSAPDPAELSF